MDPNNEPPPPEPHRQPPSTAAAAGDLITTFMEITSATAAEAQFFLESHDFDLDSAVSTFLDSSSSSITATTAETAAVETVAAVTAIAGTDAAEISADRRFPASTSSDSTPSASVSDSPSRSRSRSPAPMTRSLYNLRPRKPHSRGGDGGSVGKIRRRGVHTVADMNSTSEEEGSSGEEDSDQRPEYYTGGEKSGMLVQDPSKVNDVDEIFDQARRAGARRGTADVGQPSASSRSFTGTGRLLVSGATVPSAPQQHPLDAITHTISFWNNGFTVNDGPLRRMDDPENASFLESVKNSECPKELVPAYSKTKVELKLLRRHENFPEPVKQQIPFQGVGRTLASSSNSPPESSAATSSTNAPARATGPVVDDKLPTTSIQLRLADGTRLISRFNYHHTIRDIRTFIDASRPSGPDTYSLQTVGFPPKQLTDLDLTIEEGGLANSVVIQRL